MIYNSHKITQIKQNVSLVIDDKRYDREKY